MSDNPTLLPGAPAQGLEAEFDRACVIAVQANPVLRVHEAELLRFARSHERRPLVLKNLAGQLRQVETFLGKGDLLRNQKRRAATIEAVAALFMAAIKVKRDQDNWSPARRIQEAHKKSLHDDVAQLIREVPRDGSSPKKT